MNGLFGSLTLLRTVFLTLTLTCVLLLSSNVATSGSASPYELEAAYIYQLTNYIEWPEESSHSNEPFVISIIGETPLAEALEKIAQTKTIKGRKIQIQKDSTPETLQKSQAIFISSEAQQELNAVVKNTTKKSVLTIAHIPEAAERGIMINFYVEDGRLRYELNRKKLENEKFKVSSQLLKLAKIVEPKSAK